MPKIFGILNLTPDSFSDGRAENLSLETVLEKAKALIAAGVDVIDIGAESTRPGASSVDTNEEWSRLKPFLEAYTMDIPLSLDSRNPEIIKRALYHTDAIKYINDVSGMTNPEILMILDQHADADLKFITMHSKGGVPPSLPASLIPDSYYDSEAGLYAALKSFWLGVFELAAKFGLNRESFILDPGIGFGKNLKHSLEIPSLITELKKELELPVMIGASRKSFLNLWKNKPEASNEELDNWTREYNSSFELGAEDCLRLHF